MDKVILHIGMHKTGSSSIQASLKGYDDGNTIFANLGDTDHSIAIYTIYSKNIAAYHIWRRRGVRAGEIKELKAAYLSELEKELSRTDRQRLIISGEDIGNLEDEEKNQLLAAISSKVKIVQVVCYVRSPDNYARSFFQQRVKGGLKTIPKMMRPGYSSRIDGFKKSSLVNELIVREFNPKEFEDSSVVNDFASLLNLDKSLISDVVANQSPSSSTIKLIFLFNKTNSCFSGDLVVHSARVKFVNRISEIYNNSGSVDSKVFASICDWSETEYLKANFGIDFYDRSTRKGNHQDINNYLTDLSDIDINVLDNEILEKTGEGSFKDVAAKLNRLYYWYLYIEQDKAIKATTQFNLDKESRLKKYTHKLAKLFY